MEPGELSVAELIADIQSGLWVTQLIGSGVNGITGDYSRGASGFWIEDGEIAFPVKGLTIAGTASEMLNGIDMLGNDLDLNRSFTAPTIKISEMQIGGE